MRIGNFDTTKEVLLIAEIGNNHEGSFKVASDLVKKAADCGVGAVKFQTFRPEHYVSQSDTARFKRLKSFQLTENEFRNLSDQAHSLGLVFISTPFDLFSAEFLSEIVDAFKIASGDNNFYPLIEKVASFEKPTLVSTGISDLKQVKKIIACYENITKDLSKLCIMHCISNYPVPPEEANLQAIPFLSQELGGVPIGYSDHTEGLEAAFLAVALGSRIIEKHFTLDKNYSDFRDHQLSADPDEMALLVEKLKVASQLLGKIEKKIGEGEKQNETALRRSIIAGRDLVKGQTLSFDDLSWIRPGTGVSPGNENKLIGKKLNRDLVFGDQIQFSDIEE